MTTARPLLLIVPSADDRPTAQRLLGVAAALAEDPAVDLTVLLWAGGSSTEAFAALGPTVDAGSVNQWRPARLLARARVTPAARVLKNRRLRSLLGRLPHSPDVLIGGLHGLAALSWLPARPARTTVLVRASELRTPGPTAPMIAALREVSTVVACDPGVEEWLTSDGGVAVDRIARHGLLAGPETPTLQPVSIGLVGWSAPEVARIVGAVAADHPDATFTWFVEEAATWGLWQGPDASPLAHRVGKASPLPETTDLAALSALLVGASGPAEADLTGAARIFGVPVIDLDPRALHAWGAVPLPPAGARGRRPGWTVSVAAGVDALRPGLTGTD